MNTCPKCGSPQASELTLSGFSLRKAMWFGCGSHVLLDEPEKIISRTNQCCDQEEINDLRRKVEEDADRIRELEEQIKVKEFLLNEAMKDLETEQAAKRELYAMLGHIVDWSPELPYYIKDEYKTLFRNALAAARELLSKCRANERMNTPKDATGGCCPPPPCSADPFLEEISDEIRRGEPVGIMEALAAIEYQRQRKLQEPPPLWKRVVRFFLPNNMEETQPTPNN